MPTLSLAREAEAEAVHRECHSIWGAGLDRTSYLRMWAEVRADPWARKHLDCYVWVDERRTVLSSLKLYRPAIRLDARETRAAVVASVFTPARHRGRGHASALLSEVLERAGAQGDSVALLFSDIGIRYYESRGFRALPAEEARGGLPRSAAEMPRGWELRPMTPADLLTVSRIRSTTDGSGGLRIVRDEEHWRFLMMRARSFYSRLDGSDLSGRYLVGVWRGRFAGYLVASEWNGEWQVRDVAAEGGDPDAVSGILRAGAAQARARGLRRVYGWFPRDFESRIPEWRLRFRPRRRAVPMARTIDGHEATRRALCSTTAAAFSLLDQF